MKPNAPQGLQSGAAQRATGHSGAGGSGDLYLVRQAQHGDSAAFEHLVRKYRPRLIALAGRYTGNASDAEDATQDALVKAYRGLGDFRGECAFYTWLYRITINSAKNLLQVRARERAVAGAGVVDSDGTDGSGHGQDLETPEQLTLSEDIRAIVNASLQALPEVHREAIILREIEGMTYEQIAEVMGTPLGTVRSRVFRARELIDRELRRVFDGGLGRREKKARAAR